MEAATVMVCETVNSYFSIPFGVEKATKRTSIFQVFTRRLSVNNVMCVVKGCSVMRVQTAVLGWV